MGREENPATTDGDRARARPARSAATLGLALALVLVGCAHGGPRPGTCAAVGAVLGAGIGAGVGAGRDTGSDWDAALGAGAAGGVLLASGGYFLCRALQPKETADERLVRAFEELGLRARVTPRGVVVYLPDVLFAFGSADLDAGATNTVAAVGDVIVRLGEDRAVSVEGHTDSKGSEAFNQKLSQERAETVRDGLALGGLPQERLSARGLGEGFPVAPNENPDGTDNPDGRAENRRVEIVIQHR